MRTIKIRINGVGLAAALGAGLAAALFALMPALKTPGGLSSVGELSSGAATAWMMAFIAPLPIMLASFAFGSVAGLIAAIVGALAVGVVDLRPDSVAALHLDKIATGGLETVVFAVGFGIPAWLLSQLSLMPAAARRPDGKALVRPEEHRLGVVIATAAGFAAIGAALNIAIAADSHGSLHGFLESSASALEPMLTDRGTLPKGVDPHAVALAFVWTAMGVMAAAQLMLLVFNLWVAARVAQMSNLLTAPWPDIPSGLRVPRPLAIMLAVALGLTFAGNQLGAAGIIASGAIGMAFAFQGLAVVHALTRAKQGMRLPLLIIVYLTLFMLMPWSLIAYSLLGLIDTGLSFRDRQKPAVKKNPS